MDGVRERSGLDGVRYLADIGVHSKYGFQEFCDRICIPYHRSTDLANVFSEHGTRFTH
jgi:hypothetical protein